MTLSLGIDIKSERALNPVDDGLFIDIPVEISFTTSTGKLRDLLYKIKASPVLLVVKKIKVRVRNKNNPKDIFTTLVVKGLIKKPQPEQEARREGKSAS